ncbi:MAG TPA: 16S rRNA (adenine(1518)-N(6)/adenine(1519)-N(6))-dimethyltransferase RsmA [Candidatus Paceibacterota bacterium]|nr:16S rRNA (adenine(1518)-N(6)/adenine(1519)-N(6))-dimethyltransferase RsmA [Candidatus Paceibacterota bacterium]
MKIIPKKSLGQNFLVNKGVVQKILNAAEITNSDLVLEIGTGKGVLTEELRKKANRVIAIEKDHRLINDLKNTFREFSNVEIIEDDVFKFDPYSIIHIPYKIVANIPYYITSHLLKTIFEKWPMPGLVVLMVQKEVAQRITAKPPHMNLLALSVQFFAEPKIISYVSRGSFRPIPKVDSAIIRLVPRRETRITDQEFREKFFRLAKTAFAGKRKQLKNTVGLERLTKVGIKPESRPEELSLEDWLKLALGV